jgi:hypothetical protein
MKGKRIFSDADRALWMAQVNAQVAAFEESMNREIPEFGVQPFDDSEGIARIDEYERGDLVAAGGILKAQLRRFALTIIPSNMCGCAACIQRRNVLMREYNECAQALRALQLILANGGLVGIAHDRDKHFDSFNMPPSMIGPN